jgi:hypothetical protein
VYYDHKIVCLPYKNGKHIRVVMNPDRRKHHGKRQKERQKERQKVLLQQEKRL